MIKQKAKVAIKFVNTFLEMDHPFGQYGYSKRCSGCLFKNYRTRIKEQIPKNNGYKCSLEKCYQDNKSTENIYNTEDLRKNMMDIGENN